MAKTLTIFRRFALNLLKQDKSSPLASKTNLSRPLTATPSLYFSSTSSPLASSPS
jgi:hypothetical protein